jgi:hypothetical protein
MRNELFCLGQLFITRGGTNIFQISKVSAEFCAPLDMFGISTSWTT